MVSLKLGILGSPLRECALALEEGFGDPCGQHAFLPMLVFIMRVLQAFEHVFVSWSNVDWGVCSRCVWLLVMLLLGFCPRFCLGLILGLNRCHVCFVVFGGCHLRRCFK